MCPEISPAPVTRAKPLSSVILCGENVAIEGILNLMAFFVYGSLILVCKKNCGLCYYYKSFK